MSRQSEAIREYFDKNGIPQKDICEATKASKTTISNMLAGRFGISKKMAHALAKVYGFDVTFLLSGEGELFAPAGGGAKYGPCVRVRAFRGKIIE
jgi:transcriptional regulator with XRE-family HTH domain